MKKSLVSVVMPVYNAAHFLSSAVGSVLHQTYDNIEIILVADGDSSDASLAICGNLVESYRNITLITKPSGGPASARNFGILQSEGEFIFFMDADDIIEPDTIQKMVDGQRLWAKVDMVMSNFKKVEMDGSTTTQPVYFMKDAKEYTGSMIELGRPGLEEYVRHFLNKPSNHIISYCWAKLYKSSIIKDNGIWFDPKMKLFEDFVFNLKYFEHVRSVHFINEGFYRYIIHPGIASASMRIINADSLLSDIERCCDATSKFFSYNKDFETIMSELKHTMIYYIMIFIIRTCGQITEDNWEKIQWEIGKMVNSDFVKNGLKHYHTPEHGSKLLPVLMKWKLTKLIMMVARQKYKERYG